jgi:hypothetical protein
VEEDGVKTLYDGLIKFDQNKHHLMPQHRTQDIEIDTIMAEYCSAIQNMHIGGQLQCSILQALKSRRDIQLDSSAPFQIADI